MNLIKHKKSLLQHGDRTSVTAMKDLFHLRVTEGTKQEKKSQNKNLVQLVFHSDKSYKNKKMFNFSREDTEL